jgi:hypothetical protein
MKNILLFAFIFFLCSPSLFCQQVSGFMGRRISINVGYACNPLVLDLTSSKGYIELNDPQNPHEGAMYRKRGSVYIASNYLINAEFAYKEYSGVGIQFSSHHNVMVIQDPFKLEPYLSYTPFTLTCQSIMPYVRFYRKHMTPAPLGNYVLLGINYTRIKLDSARVLLQNNQDAYLFKTDGLMNMYDITFGIGRSFIFNRSILFRLEITLPNLLRFTPAWALGLGYGRYASLDELDHGTAIKNKVALNNWFNYGISMGIPL